ncbi:MAG: hypothetical protein VB025_10710 [Sphaerochaeta sp.]|nr:hypothetical protein [Sphaerochaeta sp.]
MQHLRKAIFILLLCLFLAPLLAAQGAKDIQESHEGINSSDVATVMKSLHFIENKLKEIDLTYDQEMKVLESRIIESYFEESLYIDTLEPEIWETDAEFEERIEREKLQIWEVLKRQYQDGYEQLLQEWASERQPYEAIFRGCNIVCVNGNLLC